MPTFTAHGQQVQKSSLLQLWFNWSRESVSVKLELFVAKGLRAKSPVKTYSASLSPFVSPEVALYKGEA
jgi:hypothetical protein